MFGGKKNSSHSEQLETIIGQNTSVKGSLNAGGALRIDGEVEGDVTTSTELIVGETGRVRATVSAKNAVVAGTVTGNMEISDKLELLASAKVVGDLKVGSLIIADGAVFKGNCEMRQASE